MTRRRLSDDERTLWRGVTRSIKPLRAREDLGGEPDSVPTKSAPRSKPMPLAPAPTVPHRAPMALAPLDRRLRQRVSRGVEAIEARLDLHGLTQAEAHDALLRFLPQCQREGARTVLVITGKGAAGGTGERGVLKRQVPIWLSQPEFRAFVVGFGDAKHRHGGQGALYVRLRRARDD